MTNAAPQRTASCRCGQLHATVTGDPVRVSVCHCLDCQKRSGSAFAAQVRFPAEAVAIVGNPSTYAHAGGGGNIARFHFCHSCGDTLCFTNDNAAGTVAIPIGAFDDPFAFAPPSPFGRSASTHGLRSPANTSNTSLEPGRQVAVLQPLNCATWTHAAPPALLLAAPPL